MQKSDWPICNCNDYHLAATHMPFHLHQSFHKDLTVLPERLETSDASANTACRAVRHFLSDQMNSLAETSGRMLEPEEGKNHSRYSNC